MKGGPGKPVELNGLERVAVMVQGDSGLMLIVELNAYGRVAKLVCDR